MSVVYVVDSNFFIQAHRVTYLLDVVPSFWNKVKELANAVRIISIDKVKKEIFKNDDDLKDWCKNNLSPDFWKDSSQNPLEYKDCCLGSFTNQPLHSKCNSGIFRYRRSRCIFIGIYFCRHY
jgi:hypothetical protein